MNKFRDGFLIISIALMLGACGEQQAPQSAQTPAKQAAPIDQPANPPPPNSTDQLVAEKLGQVLQGDWRSNENKARDIYRHPQETLLFLGLKPGQTVIEITPGTGWYTEILAPFLKGNGKLTAAIIDASTVTDERSYLEKINAQLRSKISGNQEHFGEVEILQFSSREPVLGEDSSADMVLTFRNVHNWMMWGTDKSMFQAFFKVLKPGGVLGVTDHRAQAGADLAKIKDSGYIPEDYVIKLATDAGFKLEAKGEINANSKDTKDYPKGVWTLPPTFAEGDKDKDKYRAIGESDRMTLKFVKPQGDQIFDAASDAEQKK